MVISNLTKRIAFLEMCRTPIEFLKYKKLSCIHFFLKVLCSLETKRLRCLVRRMARTFDINLAELKKLKTSSLMIPQQHLEGPSESD